MAHKHCRAVCGRKFAIEGFLRFYRRKQNTITGDVQVFLDCFIYGIFSGYCSHRKLLSVRANQFTKWILRKINFSRGEFDTKSFCGTVTEAT